MIPRPNSNEEKLRCLRWINNMGRADVNINTLKFGKDAVLCEDHFHPDCLKKEITLPEYFTKRKKKELVPGAVPTKFSHKTYDEINMDGTKHLQQRKLSVRRSEELARSELIGHLLTENEVSQNEIVNVQTNPTLVEEETIMIINVKDIIEPTHKNVGVQCEISLSDLNRSCQTDRLESCDFEAQAPEYYSISANYVAVVNDHAYFKEKTVCSTPSKRKHVCEDVSLSPINSSL
ncbi:uncharacterized protein LOC130635557 [Hydractinia symbiolongicarpus]|uniref:uncharacterized protein LOC130635557 n=1 Tax=Hydractinia symbiolongicarpus TaxID=13093 RepID=UPI002550AC00|nr:uncharacterized protein LOC130635557 [Hydractinia symbiolongicarpus]